MPGSTLCPLTLVISLATLSLDTGHIYVAFPDKVR